MKLRTPLKSHGGKHYLAPFIIDHFPWDYQRRDYVEVFAGGGSVLLAKSPSDREWLNDLDLGTLSVWLTIQRDCARFQEALRGIPYAESSFLEAVARAAEPLAPDQHFDRALNEYTLRRMSRGGMKRSFAWSARLRGGKPGDQNAWETMVERLPEVSERIQAVELRNQDFREIMAEFDRPEALLYLDPPYLKSTRSPGCHDIYGVEFSNLDHIDLAQACLRSKARIVLSCYPSALYGELFGDWTVRRRSIANHSSQARGKQTKTECIYMNF